MRLIDVGRSSRTNRSRNLKIGRNVGKHTGNKAHQYQGHRSKVKVTKPINAHTVNAQYLLNGKAYELRAWYTEGA